MNSALKNIFLILILTAVGGYIALQLTKADSTSDNPSAGLNLGDSGSLSGFPGQFDHHLVTLSDGHFKPFDASSLKDVKSFTVYLSASGGPPSRAFTPKLVEFYNAFKPKHPNFELIFVNDDQSEDA